MRAASLLAVALLGSTVGAVGLSASSADAEVERTTTLLAELQQRNFGAAVRFCAREAKSEDKNIEKAFKKYLADYVAGTRDGLLEISKTDSIAGQFQDIFQAQDQLLEQQSKQGESLMKSVERAPITGCSKLVDYFGSATQASFRAFVTDGHRDYLEKRRAYCAKSPRPKSCG